MFLVARLFSGLLKFAYLMGSPLVPFRYKLLPLLALAYLFWPRDIIPDTIPFWGLVDDVIVTALLISSFMRYAQPETPGKSTKQSKRKGRTVEANFRVLDDKRDRKR